MLYERMNNWKENLIILEERRGQRTNLFRSTRIDPNSRKLEAQKFYTYLNDVRTKSSWCLKPTRMIPKKIKIHARQLHLFFWLNAQSVKMLLSYFTLFAFAPDPYHPTKIHANPIVIPGPFCLWYLGARLNTIISLIRVHKITSATKTFLSVK